MHTWTKSANTKPTIKVYILYYKYNAIAAAIYYNPQSILVSFSINTELFADHRFLVLAAFSLVDEKIILCT